MKGWRAFAIPFAVVLAAGLAVTGWFAWEGDPGEPVEIVFDEVQDRTGYVSLDGMAHYAAVVRQDVPATLFRDAQTWWLYGFFPPYDTDGREIRVLVRSKDKPEDLVHYELMRVTGKLKRATPTEVPFETDVILGKNTDYYLGDDVMLLTADVLEPLDD